MSDTERMLRKVSLRITAVLVMLATATLFSPLALKAGAQQQGAAQQTVTVGVECPDGSWCVAWGPPPCWAICTPGGGAWCHCEGVDIIISPAAAEEGEAGEAETEVGGG